MVYLKKQKTETHRVSIWIRIGDQMDLKRSFDMSELVKEESHDKKNETEEIVRSQQKWGL